MKELPSIERLRDRLIYEPNTGLLRWRVTTSNRSIAGNVGGCYDGRYVRISIDGVTMLAHRVIVAVVTGEWPDCDVDHEDTDGYNNRWRNLRQATVSQNIANSKSSKNNTSGFKGVVRSRNGKRWRAQITHKRKWYNLGTFDTPVEASDAYLSAAIRLQGEFARAA